MVADVVADVEFDVVVWSFPQATPMQSMAAARKSASTFLNVFITFSLDILFSKVQYDITTNIYFCQYNRAIYNYRVHIAQIIPLLDIVEKEPFFLTALLINLSFPIFLH